MSSSRILKWISGGLELFLAIPLLGASIIIGNYYLPLIGMLGLHIASLVIASSSNTSTVGNILGIVTSCLAWIPLLGWLLHLITGIILVVDASKNDPVIKVDQ
ncbi:hypothetical protein ACFSKI_04075 [Pseudogracilibacillus auburnensis]|uniref:Uncharacterized protein n=1 Tax=Pseudogracilibacillus auburnensis TaxID=1494959 RepID=A0A2V3W408_9BACI|nr:hypothetical protein [Pseudogracilibacillus auburnensis]MBO1002800.1 hypothetical protein [Pseudogracilibacillus auburnensis]PXW87914.1 hypothetical protein DFR56_10462 [Pseudogracilibacillus auburnensis]